MPVGVDFQNAGRRPGMKKRGTAGNILVVWLILTPPITDAGAAMMGDKAWLLFSAVWIVTMTAAMIYVAFG